MLKKRHLAAALLQSCCDGIVRLAAVGHGKGEVRSGSFRSLILCSGILSVGLRFRRSTRLIWVQLRPPASTRVLPPPGNPPPLPGGFPCQRSRSTPQANPGLSPWLPQLLPPQSSSEPPQAVPGAPGPASLLQTHP